MYSTSTNNANSPMSSSEHNHTLDVVFADSDFEFKHVNQIIRILKKNIECKLNTYVIKELLHDDICVSNNMINNTLTLTLTYAKMYMECHKKEGENSMISLIQALISIGAKPSNAQNGTNTLSAAIQTKSLNLIRIIIGLNPLPDNHQYGTCVDANTLTHAVNTNIFDVVKIAYNVGALQDLSDTENNTLACAIVTRNTEIIKEIILDGGKCKYNCIDYEHNRNNMNNINLLLCTGARFYDTYPSFTHSISRTEFIRLQSYMFLGNCYALEDIYDTEICTEIGKLRNILKCTMDDLVSEYANRYLKKLEIEDMLPCIPVCCVGIIYSYYHVKQPFKTIDWMDQNYNPHELSF